MTNVSRFLFEFRRWAATETGILAVGLVGSHARGAATEESDVDLIVVAAVPNIYLQHQQWTSLFGDVERHRIENYGKCTSLRVWYADGLEAEYGFVDEAWAAPPLDDGTRAVAAGMKVLFERCPVLSVL